MDMKILKVNEVVKITGKSKPTLYTEINEGRFPPPIKIGMRASGFIESEVEAVMRARSIGMRGIEIMDLVKKLLDKRKERAKQLFKQLGLDE